MDDKKWGDEESTENPKEKRGNDILVKEPAIMEVVQNRFYFYAEVTRPNILKLNKELRMASNSNLADVHLRELKDPAPIYLHVNSYGGSIFAGLSGLDEILNTKVPVYTIVDGCCASAATFLTVVGTKRYINRHAFMLIHQLSSVMWGKYAEFKDEMKNLDRLMEMIQGIYGEYTKVPIKKLGGIMKHDIYFDAETCVKYGLVDEIL